MRLCSRYFVLCDDFIPESFNLTLLMRLSEFVHSARLDNLASCFLAVEALLDYLKEDDCVADDKDVSMVVLYDHEEVGSSSA